MEKRSIERIINYSTLGWMQLQYVVIPNTCSVQQANLPHSIPQCFRASLQGQFHSKSVLWRKYSICSEIGYTDGYHHNEKVFISITVPQDQ